jgi:hypothetical protein
MKHLLNNLSEEEKNRIREQHTGGKKIIIENFNKLVNTKLGDAKPLTEQEEETPVNVTDTDAPAEENPTKDMYSTLIGYLVKLSEDGDKKGIQGLEDMGAIKETRMYFENLRDGVSPQPLSEPAKIVKNYVMDETKNLSGEELFALKELGKTVQTKI